MIKNSHQLINLVILLTLIVTGCQGKGPNDIIPQETSNVQTTAVAEVTTEATTQPTTTQETQGATPITMDTTIRGNEFVNIWHDGYFVEYQGWYYISSKEDQSTYKMRPDGSEKTLVVNEFLWQLNIVDDWMYYSKYGVWKMRLDGSGKTLLLDRSKDTGALSYLYVIDKYVFFLRLEDTLHNFYRMRSDGANKQTLLEGVMGEGFIDGDYYYFQISNDLAEIWRIRLDGDGSDRELVYKHTSSIGSFNIKGENMYTASKSGGVWNINLRTGKAIELAKDECRFFNVDDGWLYFESRSDSRNKEGKPDDSGSFYKVRLDGTERQMISHLWPMNMYIPEGNWIYFLNMDKDDDMIDYLAKIRKDGTGFERLFEYHE